MGRKLRRIVLAALAAVVVSWPIVGFTATVESGPQFAIMPALKIGGIVLGLGIIFALWEQARGYVPRHPLAKPAMVLNENKSVRIGVLIALVVAMAVLPMFASSTWVRLLVETMVFATIAIGLNISMGMAGLLVLGHAAFWAVGAYTFVMLTIHWNWNFWMAFPAAGIAAALVGLVIGLPAIRLRGDYLAIVTLGFGEAIRWVIKNNAGYTGGDAGIPGSEVRGDLRAARGALGEFLWQPKSTQDCYFFALGLLVLCVVVVTLLTKSRYGRALFALREDETAARCMGINTTKVKLIAFMASAMWAGLAGVIHPIFRGQITPQLFDFNASVLFVSMVVLGGLGSVPGSILGAVILFILPQQLRAWIPEIQEYRMLIFGAVLTAMMVVRPEGLLGGSSHVAGADDDDEEPAAVPAGAPA